MIRQKIIKDLEKTCKKLGLTFDKITVDYPPDLKFGDYTTNLPLQQQKQTGDKGWQFPLLIAKKIAKDFSGKDYLKKTEVVAPGFINFFLKNNLWQHEIANLINKKEIQLDLEKRKILVEFAHPNTHKLFHLGHLRNIIIGESISRLLETVGNRVYRVNYQGDIGLHIAKVIWGIKKLGFKNPKTLDEKIDFLSKAYIIGNKAYEEANSTKREIEEINKKLYKEDLEILKIWKETKEWSLDYFDRIYKRLGTKFDRLYFESQVAQSGKNEVIKFTKHHIFVKSKGAIIFPGEKYGLHNRVFITSFGLPTYESKDVGLAKLQLNEYSPDLIVHVVGPEQKGYFEVLFKALEQIYPEAKGRELHLLYGWVRLKTGKMSSRSGEVVTADWLLNEAKKRALAILEESKIVKENVNKEKVTEVVAVGAVKYSFLKMNLAQDLIFDFEESITLTGNSGPYLQYTHARCKSVIRKAKSDFSKFSFDDGVDDELLLLRTIGRFKEVVINTAQTFSPNILTNFLYEVAKRYNTFYGGHPILAAEKNSRNRRLFLTKATASVLKEGLGLLGIAAPEEM